MTLDLVPVTCAAGPSVLEMLSTVPDLTWALTFLLQPSWLLSASQDGPELWFAHYPIPMYRQAFLVTSAATTLCRQAVL